MKKLWYDKAARNWNQALPIGNGRLGAMVFGEPIFDRLQINEETLWSGGPVSDSTVYGKTLMDGVRELVKKRKYKEADDEIKPLLKGDETASYVPYGYLNIDVISERGEVENYRRELDLETGVATVRYTLDGSDVEKTAFVYCTNVLVGVKNFNFSVKLNVACANNSGTIFADFKNLLKVNVGGCSFNSYRF